MLRSTLTLTCLLAIAACSAPAPAEPDLEALYERAARFHDTPRNPVIVIPGVLGSRLVDDATGTLVWGAFTGDFADPDSAEGARFIAHPMDPSGGSVALADLHDDVRSDGALESIEVSVLGLPFSLSAYRGILRTLGAGGYVDQSLVTGEPSSLFGDGTLDWGDEHFTCFQFDYDWRRSIPENAARLGAFIDARAQEVRADRARRFGPAAGLEAVEFDLVAHSLGGLVARWYLRYGADQGQPVTGAMTAAQATAAAPSVSWAGAPKVSRAILVAPPNLGSPGALNDLVFGMDLGRFAATYPPHITGTLPVAYQLLPTAPGALLDNVTGRMSGTEDGPDVLDPALWRNLGWGLAGVDDDALADLLPGVASAAERRAIALDHQAKCLNEARRVKAALGAPATPPEGLELVLFAGDAHPTVRSQQFLVDGGQLWTRSHAAGDGVVPRASALADLRPAEANAPDWTPRLVSPIDWASVVFVFEDHLGLTDSPAFVDNLLFQLLEAPR